MSIVVENVASGFPGAPDKLLLQGLQYSRGVGFYGQFQETLLLTPAHGQYPVARASGEWFTEFKIVSEFGRFLFLALYHFRVNDSLPVKMIPYRFPCPLVFVHPFGNNIPCPLQCIFDGFNIPEFCHLEPDTILNPAQTQDRRTRIPTGGSLPRKYHKRALDELSIQLVDLYRYTPFRCGAFSRDKPVQGHQ